MFKIAGTVSYVQGREIGVLAAGDKVVTVCTVVQEPLTVTLDGKKAYVSDVKNGMSIELAGQTKDAVNSVKATCAKTTKHVYES